MAVYNFSELADGQAIEFDPTVDVLHFDQSLYSAADLRVVEGGSNSGITWDADGFPPKRVVLVGAAPLELTTSNVTFANGSLLLHGDNLTTPFADNNANTLNGGSGGDLLAGFGGADTLNGGLGNDTYVVGTGDVVSDSGGTDTVLSSVSWSLGASSNVENLTLTGTAAITANGNNLHNIIHGNDADNSSINGRAGNDHMEGHGGNDTFDMSTGGTSSYGNDFIHGGDGVDTIDFGANARSSVFVDLVAGRMNGGGDAGEGFATVVFVENVVGGNFADSFIGNAVANFFFGGAGNDRLDGGQGNDRLQGGTGSDLFVFSAAPGTANSDTVVDFASGVDGIRLDGNAMVETGPTGNFVAGDARFWAAAGATSGHDADDRIVYNTTTRQVFYDADGSGSGAALLIATLQSGATLVATDLSVENGHQGDQVVNGTAGNDSLVGGDGNDTLNGFAGNDVLNGMRGDDSLSGGDGDDTLLGSDGNDWADGGLGNDTYVDLGAAFGVNVSDAGGIDTAIVHNSNSSYVELDPGIENLVIAADFVRGPFFDTPVVGNELANDIRIETPADHDALLLVSGGAGDDTVHGGDDGEFFSYHGGGHDSIDGGGGHDRISGGHGNSVIDFSTGTAHEADDPAWGSATFASMEEASGGTGDDLMIAGDSGVDFLGWVGDDTLVGGAGDDLLQGAGVEWDHTISDDGSDDLSGGAGNDTLNGGPQSDRLNGGLGNDRLGGDDGNGPFGDDVFVFDVAPGEANADMFAIFTSFGEADSIELHASAMAGLGAAGRLAVGDARFYSAAGATGGHDADDRIVYDASSGRLYYDADGSGSGAAQLIGTNSGDDIQATDIVVQGEGGGGQVINGTAGNDTLTGGDGDDTINGFAGNDSLNGGEDGADSLSGGEGNDTLNSVAMSHGDGKADTLDGGLGDDVYFVNDDGDVILADTGGFDTVHAMNGGWILGAGLENLDLDDTVGGAFTGVGNDLNNVIRGSSEGGELFGMGGNDTLIVRSAFNHSDLFGGDGNDSLIGGDRVDLLDGGAGVDTLNGGLGDDTYVVAAGDVIVADTGGIDLVRSEVSWSLGATSNLENLTLTGTAATTANGNQLDNVLTGNDASNSSINGRAGNDTMFGMGGNDTFDMSTGGTLTYGNDVIDGGSGTDTVDFGANARSAVNVNLAGGTMAGGGDAGAGSATLTSIENAVGGNFNDVLTGNAAANFFFGGNGNDTLNGGAGNDRLQGGAGNDAFVFAAAPGSANSDVVVDFVSAVDKLQFDDAFHTAIGATGNFAAGDARFWAAAGASAGHDANDRVIYNTSNGSLYYDADGSGSGAAQLVATLQGNPGLTATDIAVI